MNKRNLTGKLFGDYILGQCLGQGHFGAVYLAKNRFDQAQVAIKILRADVDKDHLISLLTEARAFRLQHPHIVRIIDFGIAHERLFLVMNYIPNGNLRRRHPEGTRVPWATVVTYVRQIAEALQHIHDHGIVHRDIKPENMLVGEHGEIILGDFGIATPSSTWELGQKQRPQGTPLYIAPEQYKGHAVRASDQYALGVVMYEWLAGSPPFVAGTAEATIARRFAKPPSPLRALVPDLPLRAEEVVMRLLSFNPEARFASMREFLAELEQVQRHTVSINPHVFQEHREGIRCLGWSSDSHYIASGGRDRTVLVWGATTGSVVYAYTGHNADIWSLAWSPDNRHVVSAGEDQTVRVWEATTGYPGPVYREHTSIVRAIAWSPDGKSIASAGDGRAVRVWDAESGITQYIYYPHKENVCALAWSPSGTWLASGGNDGEIYLWKRTDHAHPVTTLKHKQGITSLAWSSDEMYLASASDDSTVCIWDVATWQKQQTYTAHKDVVSVVAWLPQFMEKRVLASGSWDTTVHVWQMGATKPQFTYTGHHNWVNTLSWAPSGQYLVSGSWDKTVHIFKPE